MKSHVFCFILVVFVMIAVPVQAERGTDSAFRSTAYPLPRFVSLAAEKVYVRAGPGERFPIKWEFRKRGLPIEIILEFDHWRKVRDHEGAEGWIHKSLLSGRRTGLVIAEEQIAMRRKPREDGRLVAYIEPLVVTVVEACEGDWCRLSVSGFKGWAERHNIWGVYPDEDFN